MMLIINDSAILLKVYLTAITRDAIANKYFWRNKEGTPFVFILKNDSFLTLYSIV